MPYPFQLFRGPSDFRRSDTPTMHGKPPSAPLDSFWLNAIRQSTSRRLDIEDRVLLATSSQPCARQLGDGEQGL